MPLTIALIHMKMRLLARKSNMEKARKLIRDAAQHGAKIVVLPSMLNSGPFYLYFPLQRSKTVARNQAERIPGPTTELLANAALETSTFIVGGPILERAGPKLFLTSFVISPNGVIMTKYRKVCVNGLDAELGISNGKSLQVLARFPRALGLMAEDDIYNPEIARGLLLMGATVFIASLRFGDDVSKVRTMLIARSIENNVPVLAVGGVFETPSKVFVMPTMVVDPKKGVVEEIEDETDTFMLVEVKDTPEAVYDIIYAALNAKAVSQLYCKAARESIVENLAAKLPPRRESTGEGELQASMPKKAEEQEAESVEEEEVVLEEPRS